MKSRDWFILIFTFAVGIFSGMYFYVTSFKPNYDTGILPSQSDVIESFTVSGSTYGGFTTPSYVHPSFRIEGDRVYDYRPGGDPPPVTRDGIVNRELFAALEARVENSNLDALAAPVTGKNCVSFADGTEYRYVIVHDGDRFVLDTCDTAFENNTELGQVLLEVWEYLDAPDTYSFSIQNYPSEEIQNNGFRGLGGLIQERLEENFQR